VRGEGEEPGAVWVLRHGVSDRGDQRPAGGGAGEVVGCCVGVEGRVACGLEGADVSLYCLRAREKMVGVSALPCLAA